jgi:hypothetical protein
MSSPCSRQRTSVGLFTLVVALLPARGQTQTAVAAPVTNVLARRYHEGEKLTYRMKASNRGQQTTNTYEVQADGVVKKDSSGRFIEEFAWTKMVRNGTPVALSPAAIEFRQVLSLEPGYSLSVPNLAPVIPLAGPITDLLTLYADMSVKNQGKLLKVGDHFYFKHGAPNSWADGNYVVRGEDSIDFDVTLSEVDAAGKTATLTIQHVPPAQPEIKVPVEWMREAVGDTPNNWVEVTKQGPAKYFAEVGKETFDVRITLSLEDGRILRATIDNPVEVRARPCTDAALSICGDPVRYQIRRQIEVVAVKE